MTRKFIFIEPTPTKDMKRGLWIEYNKVKEGTDVKIAPYARCDILKGRSRYPKPKCEEGRYVKRVFIKKDD